MDFNIPEITGYIASVLVAASLMMSNIRMLRWVNLIGALAFTAYGFLLKAWPVFGVNFMIVIVDIYYIDRMSRQKDFFTLLEVINDSSLLKKFLRFYEEDIKKFFPSGFKQTPEKKGLFILRNLNPVGVFFYEIHEDNHLEIHLDYVIPEYRDGKNAEFLFRILNEKFNTYDGFRIKSSEEKHINYLKRQGFHKKDEYWCKQII